MGPRGVLLGLGEVALCNEQSYQNRQMLWTSMMLALGSASGP